MIYWKTYLHNYSVVLLFFPTRVSCKNYDDFTTWEPHHIQAYVTLMIS